MARHDEVAWVPMCTTENGSWFWTNAIADRQRDARANFVAHCKQDWKVLRKEGWRIVLVRLTTELHQ